MAVVMVMAMVLVMVMVMVMVMAIEHLDGGAPQTFAKQDSPKSQMAASERHHKQNGEMENIK